jgi:hypothetical protein
MSSVGNFGFSWNFESSSTGSGHKATVALVSLAANEDACKGNLFLMAFGQQWPHRTGFQPSNLD